MIRQDEMRTPPHSVEAEQAVLGGLMLDPNAWDAVADIISAADFYRRDHRLIFEAVAEVAETRGSCDAVTISEHLERKGRLDEIGTLSPGAQGNLLRVLQEGEIERLGDTQTRRVDVRVIAATNADLREEVSAGRFREDLFFRLNVFPIRVIPLRERREDILPLARAFVVDAAGRTGRKVGGFTPAESDGFRRAMGTWCCAATSPASRARSTAARNVPRDTSAAWSS